MTRYGASCASSTRVYIGQAPGGRSRGLTEEIGDDDLRNYFDRYGTVTGVAQHRWEDSGRKKGFGYMEFQEFEGAQAALGEHTVMGVALEVKTYVQGDARGAPGAARGAPAHNPGNLQGNPSTGYTYGGPGGGYNSANYGYGSDAKR